MRPVEELINTREPGWELVQTFIQSAKNNVEILEVDSNSARECLYKIQVTTRSPMGAIVYMSGGILIDHGWIRILGSGSSKMKRTLPDWNLGKSIESFDRAAAFYLIADDAIGGFFILNGGEFGNDLGKVYYFAPDNLEFEPLDLTYTEFLTFCFSGDLNKFYEDYRFENWQKEILKLSGDEVFNFYPPLWTKEGKQINKVSRKAVPAEEQYSMNLSLRAQLSK